MHGQIQPFGLLDNPLLYWNSKFQLISTSKDVNLALKDLLHQNLSSNPFIQKYITNIEKPNPTHGLCVLSSSIVEEILAKTNTGERPFSSMDVEPFIQNLSLLFNMNLGIPHNFDDAFEIGKVTMCNNDNPFKTERLLVQEDGMCTNPTLNMTLEKALFPFLFPHGCGAYDGIGGLLLYLKQRMSTLFFVFTLYPPYLLLMYQVQQVIQLLNATKHLCLERDVKRLKCQHLQWSEIDVLRNIMKFKLPLSIPLTPQWYHTQFKKLLVMVENFGMLHFFLILTSDETSNLRWKEIKDIENLAMFFNNTFSWKDCPVECVALFCARLQAFMSTYDLGGENIINLI
jgi:hypothetical protein